MGQYTELTETVHKGRDSTQDSPRQCIEDGTVHITHQDSSQRTRQYTELTETVHKGRDSTQDSPRLHRGRDSTHTGTQYTEDGAVHTNHQNTVLKMGRYTHHGTQPTENEAVKTTQHDTFRNGCDSTHTSPGHHRA